MKPVRVLQVITRLIVGGAQETVMYAAALMDRERFQVEVLSGPQTGSEGSLLEELQSKGLPLTLQPHLLREISPRHDLLALAQMARFMRLNRYDIVHTNSSKAGILGRLAARLAGVPVIVHTVHGWSFHEHMSPRLRGAYILLERFTASFSDALIVVTRQDIEKGLKGKIGRAEQYRLIRSAIPLEAFDPVPGERESARRELDIPADVPVLGNVGRFSEQKNPLDWVRIAARVASQLPDCRFLLVGDGPLRPQVEALLEKENLSGRVILTGLRRDVSHLMAAMDVFLLTSLWEGLPRVIPQAMRMGLPVVAYGVDGSSEAIQPGETGYICPPGALEEMAARCLELLGDQKLRQSMGQKGRRYATQEFDVHRMVSQIEALYQELLPR